MTELVILGELSWGASGTYKISFCGAFKNKQIKMISLRFKPIYLTLVNEIVFVWVSKAYVQNAIIYCFDYELKKVN